jgi:putative ABC transport system substrate-binding protein
MKQLRISDFEFRIGSTALYILAVALGLLAASMPSDAQQPGKVYRIGFYGGDMFAPTEDKPPKKCPTTGGPNWQGFVDGLREHGYIPGQNLVIECRWDGGRYELAPVLAAEFVQLKVDLIVVTSGPRVRTTKEVTHTIPIVMVYVAEPVANKLVASLARPGGNVTGVSYTAGPEIAGKYLQLLQEAVPALSRVAVLLYPDYPVTPAFLREAQAAAQALGLTLQSYDVRNPKEFEGAFAAMTKARTDGLLVQVHPIVFAHPKRVAELAAQTRLPAVYPYRDLVVAGGLMAYEANIAAMFRRAPAYVDKILKGANAGDLPVEQPTKFDLVINLKTAKALGLTIPPSLLMRADQVIE